MMETPERSALEPTALWGFAKWAAKVVGAASLGGATAAFTFYTTWQGMQVDLKAQGVTLRVHTVQIEALQAADAAQALVEAREDARAAAEREAAAKQLEQIRQDLQYIQRELIGRIRR